MNIFLTEIVYYIVILLFITYIYFKSGSIEHLTEPPKQSCCDEIKSLSAVMISLKNIEDKVDKMDVIVKQLQTDSASYKTRLDKLDKMIDDANNQITTTPTS